MTAEIKAQAGKHIAVLIHQKQLGISSCPVQTPGLPPVEGESPEPHGGSAVEGELGESCWVSEGRRGGQAGREVSEFSIAVVLFC